MGYQHVCETDLSLGLDLFLNKPDHDQFQDSHHDHDSKKVSPRLHDHHCLFTSLKLGLSSEDTHQAHLQLTTTALLKHQQPSTLISAVSSYSNSSVKKERGLSLEEVDRIKFSSKVSHDHRDEKRSSRKKLRLTKQQSAILEDSFKEQNSLNLKEKQALSKQLNLQPRQVEVWFQNRRSRTKLKQTEVDYELLKQCCEALTEENRRLKMELKALKLTPLLHMQPPAANLTVCPGCESNGFSEEDSSKCPFPLGTKTHISKYPFNHPSVAC